MAATASARTSAKKAKPAEDDQASGTPAPPALSDGVLRLVPLAKDKPAERVPVFAITDDKGKEHVYDMPAKAPFNVAVEFGYRVGQSSYAAALDWLLDEMLTPEGFAALRAYPDLEPEQFGEVLRIVQDRALGSREAPKGE